ncbi:MAG TPA: hypothetical protein VN635_10200 [Conexibacter sp.]|nr:hypothetical protein [Conexibacter sp.]
MRTIRVKHYHEPGYGWSFDSPDISRFRGGPAPEADFEAACRWAEDAVQFVLEGEAEERGEAQVEEARVVHLVASPAAA